MPYHNKRLYKKDGDNYKLTDSPFEKEVFCYISGKMKRTGKARCFVYGPIRKGQFLSTYYLRGIAFATTVEEIAFAKSLTDKSTHDIEEIEIEFLQRPNA